MTRGDVTHSSCSTRHHASGGTASSQTGKRLGSPSLASSSPYCVKGLYKPGRHGGSEDCSSITDDNRCCFTATHLHGCKADRRACVCRYASIGVACLRREFDATKDFGKLLGLTLQLLDGPGAWVLAGFPCTAGESDEDGFEAMVEEAQTIAGCRLNRKGTVRVHVCVRVYIPVCARMRMRVRYVRVLHHLTPEDGPVHARYCRCHSVSQIYPGEDFPFCPHRPTARFLLAEVASQDGNGTAATTSAEAAVTTAATTTTAA